MVAAAVLIVALAVIPSCSSSAKAGPNGGDVVPLDDEVRAEVLANSDTGEVMIHTWDSSLENAHPLDAKPLLVGSGDETISLDPHPMSSDPEDRCSRFYGQANWVIGGKIHHGWIRTAGAEPSDHHFDWNSCWAGGEANGSMWSEMEHHRRGMGTHKGHRGHGNH